MEGLGLCEPPIFCDMSMSISHSVNVNGPGNNGEEGGGKRERDFG